MGFNSGFKGLNRICLINVALLNYGRKTFCSVTFSLRKHYLLNVCHAFVTHMEFMLKFTALSAILCSM